MGGEERRKIREFALSRFLYSCCFLSLFIIEKKEERMGVAHRISAMFTGERGEGDFDVARYDLIQKMKSEKLMTNVDFRE